MDIQFNEPLVIGERLTAKITADEGSTTEIAGKYHGVVRERGMIVHFFTEATVAGIPKPCIGFECALQDGPSSDLRVAQIMEAEGIQNVPADAGEDLKAKLGSLGLDAIAQMTETVDATTGSTAGPDEQVARDFDKLMERYEGTKPRLDREALHKFVDSTCDVIESLPHLTGQPQLTAGLMMMALQSILARKIATDPEDYVVGDPLPE